MRKCFALALIVAILLCTATALAQTQYTLYIGINDKDDYTQYIATEEAMAMV